MSVDYDPELPPHIYVYNQKLRCSKCKGPVSRVKKKAFRPYEHESVITWIHSEQECLERRVEFIEERLADFLGM